LNIVAGYSNNQSKVVKDAESSGYLGLRPEDAGPQQLINFWISYSLTSTKLKGLGLGFGGNAASEYYTLNRSTTGSFALPAYQVYNVALSYKGANYLISFKLNNLLNTKYYSGWSTVTAQQLRSASIALNYNF
jgi:iron complex outermembrane receptor protein